MGPEIRGLVVEYSVKNVDCLQPMRNNFTDPNEIKLILCAVKPRKKVKFTKPPRKNDFLFSGALHGPEGHFGRNKF